MATTSTEQPPTAAPASAPATAPAASQTATTQQTDSRPDTGHDASTSPPVELSTLPTAAAEPASNDTPTTASKPEPASQTQEPKPSQPAPAAADPVEPVQPVVTSASEKPAPPNELTRAETEAIGPSTDTPAAKPDTSNGPVVVITLLLTTGARHPYKIDEKYLKKRNVNVEDMDPYNISVYTLKELIWRDWREEWEPRPTAPTSIRLIHFGRMLDDKSPLKECRFQTEAPNVVHMTVKPQELIDEEDAKTGKDGRRRDGDDESHAGCRCVIL
ncbi:ubiquitin-like protein [Aaosphaeria arxii CBS 175.79]|uniref:Ubiquitin-like protein n=1 Tax=Aaosphaeria arxii CBS 175.79 TaxID=1450172 RepID=A0A6A5Y0A2_9PLEO|nr:ubiquitin-like protein [Aaosphaeria arxii CBS 175.79]KAF2018613.1 ubiquitin-like protein [Aaosphaeria arxii CBS 175.79]